MPSLAVAAIGIGGGIGEHLIQGNGPDLL